MKIVDRGLLEALARRRPQEPPRRGPSPRHGQGGPDARALLEELGLSVAREGPWGSDGGHRYVLEECPWCGNTDRSAYVLSFRDGGIHAGCHHDSCKGKTARDLVALRGSGSGSRETEDPNASRDRKGGRSGHPSQSELLLRLAAEAEYWHTPGLEPYATVALENGPRENHPLRSRGYKNWLVRTYYRSFGRPPAAQVLRDALDVLEARALYDGAEHAVFVRVAELDDAIYLDLSNERWEAVEITADGWRLVDAPPVRFRRPRGQLALPRPRKGGQIGRLRGLLNLGGDDEGWALILAWLLQVLRGRGPFPVLILLGEQGTAKSFTQKLLRTLLDASIAAVRTAPRDERDLIVSAHNSWVVSVDNVSSLAPWLSDALCRLATGGGLSTRQLYTDSEEVLFEAMRPSVINGITDVATRPDLLDRSLIVVLPPITPEKRRAETDLMADFQSLHPDILGGLCDAASVALRNLASTHLNALPRMADFATWATAAEQGLGLEPGGFLEAYSGNRREAVDQALESDPVAVAVTQLMDGRDEWVGTASTMWQELCELVDESVRHSKSWPGAPNALSARLKRLAPPLREKGIDYDDNPFPKNKDQRLKRLRRVAAKHRPDRPPSDDADGPDGAPPHASGVGREEFRL